MTKAKLSQEQLSEIARCKQSFRHFLRYLQVPTMKGQAWAEENARLEAESKAAGVPHIKKPVVMRLTWKNLLPTQRKTVELLESGCANLGILKARQEGQSTIIAAFLFWCVLLSVNVRIAVVAHHEEPAKQLLKVYKFFYNHLPVFLQFPTKGQGSMFEMVWEHRRLVDGALVIEESFIKVWSADSEGPASSWYSHVHASEVSRWENLNEAFGTIFPMVHGLKIVETTARGMNQFQKWWFDDTGFAKVFYSWPEDPTYVSDEPAEFTEEEQKYIETWKLTPPQARWYAWTLRRVCNNHQQTFNQEYPASPGIAFVTTGDPFFKGLSYSSAEKSKRHGDVVFAEPRTFAHYVMGVDTASGSDQSDCQSIVVLDATYSKQQKAKTVYTFMAREGITRFVDRVVEVGRKYNNALAVVERNKYGVPAIDRMLYLGYTNLFCRISTSDNNGKVVPGYGWNTDEVSRWRLLYRLNEWLKNGWLEHNDPRLKHQIMAFMYNARGKPEAVSGENDDLVLGYGMALMGLDQIGPSVHRARRRKPLNVRELIEYELASGKVYRPEDFDDSPEDNVLDRDIAAYLGL